MPTQPEGVPGDPGPRAQPASVPVAEPHSVNFRKIHDEYFGFVWRYAANRGVPGMAIDDVVQEVFVVVHQRLGSFEGRSSLKTWIGGIAYNVVRGYVRKPGNRSAGEPLADDDRLQAPGIGPAEAFERKAALRLLDQLLDAMTDIQREVFILSEMEQLSGVEIAEVLGVNENTVRARLMAARRSFNEGVARARLQRGPA